MAGKFRRRIKKFARRVGAIASFGTSLAFDKKTRKEIGGVLGKVGGKNDFKASEIPVTPGVGNLPIFGDPQQSPGGPQRNFGKLQELLSRNVGGGFGGGTIVSAAKPQPTGPTPQSIWASAPMQQQQQIDMLRQQSMGMGGPSAAAIQHQMGMDESQRRMMAMAAGNRGNQALAQRQALQAGEQMFSQGNQQAALMRAQEQLAAQQQLGGALQGLGSQGLQAASLMQHGQLSEEEMRLREAMNRQNLKAGIAQQNAQVIPNIVQGTGQMVSTGVMASDKRSKKNVKSAKKKDIAELLDRSDPKTFKYKKPEYGPKGLHLGVMAQDLEKSRIGKAMVEKGSDGIKRIDTQKLLSAVFASSAHLHKRVEELEKKNANPKDVSELLRRQRPRHKKVA